MKIAIIEDDTAPEALKQIVEQSFPDVGLYEASDLNEARAVLNENNPDLLLLDIQLGNGTAFDLLESKHPPYPKIIFTTAYSDYALRAIKFSAIDYLLKPIDPAEVRRAIRKAISHTESNFAERLNVLEGHLKVMQDREQKIVLSDLEGFHIICIKDIIRCEGEKNYTTFYMSSGHQITTSKSLIEYERMLPSNSFMRVHKSQLINIAHIEKLSRGIASQATLINGDVVKVSRDKKQELVQKLKEHVYGGKND